VFLLLEVKNEEHFLEKKEIPSRILHSTVWVVFSCWEKVEEVKTLQQFGLSDVETG